jgi:hypothetical protein
MTEQNTNNEVPETKKVSEPEQTFVDNAIHNLNGQAEGNVDLTRIDELMSTMSPDSLMDSMAKYLSNTDNIIKADSLTLSSKIGELMDKMLRIRMRTKIITDELSKPTNISDEELSNFNAKDYKDNIQGVL